MGTSDLMLETVDPVEAQYQRWIYPPPRYDLSQPSPVSLGVGIDGLRTMCWAYWPNQPMRDDLDVLVAGCGTQAAATCAYLYPRCRVVGIDISAPSLEHEQFLKDKYHLANLELHKCPVEQVESLGQDFDFVACHGVLHHTLDPVAGLSALKEVMRRDAVASLMVYGKYGRDGVYMLQEMFRTLGLEQRVEDVALVRATLGMLGSRHPVQRYVKLALDLGHDSGIVDTFLHPRDRAYSVGDCLDLVRDAGLVFQGWDENALYYPDAQMRTDSRLWEEIEKLPDERIWQVMELFYGNTPGHNFFVCRPERPVDSYRIRFESLEFLDYVPVLRISQVLPPDAAQGHPVGIGRPPYPTVYLETGQAALIGQVDGNRTIGQCLVQSALGGCERDKVEFARNFFRSLWRFGYVMFRKPAPSA